MSVVCESISVIVRCDVLNAKYPGGVAGFEADAPNDTYCSDGLIGRIGFMTPWQADLFIERLCGFGFALVRDGEYADIALVDQHAGLARPCWWLETAQIPGIRIATLVGQSVGRVMAPPGWTRDRAKPVHLPETLDFVADTESGRPVLVWRSLDAEN